MAKLTKEQLEKQKKELSKKLDMVISKIEELEKPNKIGFVYKNRIV